MEKRRDFADDDRITAFARKGENLIRV